MTEYKQPNKYESLKDMRKINQVRAGFGMSKIESKIRECLTCGRDFRSEGPHNRLCRGCRDMVGRRG